jgi:opacity protein-like surface antigen
MKLYKTITLLGVLLSSAIHAHAQGLLGVDHVTVSGGYTSRELDLLGNKIKSNGGYNFSLEGNVSLIEPRRSDIGLDLIVGAHYAHAKKSETVLPLRLKGSLNSTDILTALRPYVKLDENFRLFAQAGIGWAHSKLKLDATNLLNGASTSGSTSADGFVWGIGGGLEVIVDAFSIQASATYTDGFDSTYTSNWLLGIQANYWLNEQWGLGIGYMHESSDYIKGDSITGSVRFQF